MEPGLLFETSRSSNKKKITLAIASVFGVIAVVCAVNLINQSSLSQVVLEQYQLEEYEFRDFMRKYNKEYTDEEFVHRFYTSRQNAAFIRIHNAQNKDWTLGINAFADMTFEEFRKIYLPQQIELPEPKNVWTPDENLEIPANVDWRQQGAVTEVKNQGSCGSCWSFSTTGAVEGMWKIAGNQLVSLSEQQLISCSSGYGNNACGGGFYDYAFEYIYYNGGITTENNYPYVSANGAVPGCNPGAAGMHAATLNSYYNVAANNPNALMAAIAQQPVSVSVEADQYVWQYYSGGIITGNCGTNLDHAVLAVGYVTQTNIPYYIVKNSWGAQWGANGYVAIAITSGYGICGIQMGPSFPAV